MHKEIVGCAASLSENDLTTSQGYQSFRVQRIKQNSTSIIEDNIIEETPIALSYNGISHAVMMATPTDIAYLAKGFSLSEAIIPNLSSLYDLEINHYEEGIEVQMQIATQAFVELKQHKRTMEGRTGCGLCGIENLQQLNRPLKKLAPANPAWLDTLTAVYHHIKRHQPITQATGAAHAAAWVVNGEIIATFEDVGRHNALDKLLGYLLTEQRDTTEGFVFMTSRASYELVRKCTQCNIRLLATISAPTTQAIKLANESGLTLASFCREDGYVVYAQPQSI